MIRAVPPVIQGDEDSGRSNPRGHLARYGGLSLLVILVIKNAWVCDDAFISFRSIDNWLGGFGLTWNIDERVQVFTHTLWVIFLAPIMAFSREAFITVMLVSVLVTIVVAVLVAWRSTPNATLGALALLTLALSQTFVDYSTSGLENPLLHLLLVLFVLAINRESLGFPGSFLPVLLFSLVYLTRPDAVLLVFPALAWRFRNARNRNLSGLLWGLSPLVLWESFSLFYYGAPFPNTALAKLATGLDPISLIRQGSWYFLDTLFHDPLTVAGMATGVLVGIRRRGPPRALAMGIVLYLGWILHIGGDFMGGRFFSAPFLLAVLIVVSGARSTGVPRGRVLAMGALFVVALGFSSPRSPLLTGLDHGLDPSMTAMWHGVTDERGRFYPGSSLVHSVRTGIFLPKHDWVSLGLELQSLAQGQIVELQNVGFAGYFAGPGVHIIDSLALTDPFLARLPVSDRSSWRPGHFSRELPPGYRESLENQENLIINPALSEMYQAVRCATHGKLSCRKRVAAIWRLNTGAFKNAVRQQRIYAERIDSGLKEMRLGRPGDAADSFRAATIINPYRATPDLLLSSALLAQEDLPGAVQAIEEAVRKDPVRLTIRLEEVAVRATVVSKFIRAPTVEDFLPALDRRPRMVEVHLAVGARLMERSCWSAAEEVLHSALSPELEIGRYRQVPGNSAAKSYRKVLHATVRQNLATIRSRRGVRSGPQP